MVEPYIGQIILFGGNFAPQGWAFCDGLLLPIAQYSSLYSIIGTTFGGDGKTNFALPDLRGCTVLHPNVIFNLGTKAGRASKHLTSAHIPAHTHAVTVKVRAKSTAGDSKTPINSYPANTGIKDKQYSAISNDVMADDMLSTTVSTEGGNLGISNMQPYQAVNFIIALQGIFPPRP